MIFLRYGLTLLAFSVNLAVAALPHGYLDVTTLGADPTGATDSTEALQAAIHSARERGEIVWLPPGTYRVSERLEAQRLSNRGNVIMGSTVDPNNRAVIYLAPNCPGFGNPGRPKVVLHFFNAGTADSESATANQFDQGIVAVDFRIGQGNDGAAALRMQGAEGCTIQDVHIDLREGGSTGILGVPGSGGSTHDVTVLGGRIGIDTRRPPGLAPGGSQPTPVVTGATLIGQSEAALFATTRGAFVLVGAHIVRETPGPAILLWQSQSSPFYASLQVVESLIEYTMPSPESTVVEAFAGAGRSFSFEDTYVKNVGRVWPGIEANGQGWAHIRRAAVEVTPAMRPWGQPSEPVYVNGFHHGNLFVDTAAGIRPPVGFIFRHRLPEAFPTWETPGIVDVTALGAVGDGDTDNHSILQRAIVENEMLFFPKGIFAVSAPLELRPTSKLVGTYHTFTTLQAISTLDNRFAGTTAEDPDEPIIRTADVAAAETWLGFLQIRRTFPLANHNPTPVGNYALEWRSGGASLLRMVEVQARPSRNFRPDFAAANFYGRDIIADPLDPNHPQSTLPDGQWAWPCNHPNVVVRGNGGGRWYNFWVHGRQALREHVPFLLVEGTTEPLHLYHLHLQQQDSRHHAEFINAANVSIYGTKAEIKGALLYFEDSRNIRLFGHGGLSSPDPTQNPPYLFRFHDCEDFLIGGLSDTINEGEDNWIGTTFDRWIHANFQTWFPLEDAASNRPAVIVPSEHRPILYLRGDPAHVAPTSFPGRAPPPWQRALSLGIGAFFVEWFGTIFPQTHGYLYHTEHGWLFTHSPSADGLWLWQEGTGWLFTTDALYPIHFSADRSAWLYYLPGGEPANRWFYDFRVREWFALSATSLDG